jgi:SAM-dependent methyltransferase
VENAESIRYDAPPRRARELPGAHLDYTKMPGHWLLAHMGKRVLRPGGLELTTRMLDALGIGPDDRVVEFAPGLGATARLALARKPAAYTGIERDDAAASCVRRILTDSRDRCLVGTASATGLEDESATVVYGEAMLSMHTATQKAAIVREAFRLLEPGGRYGIHELGLEPDTLDGPVKDEVMRDLSAAIHVGARPLTASEWRAVLEAEGFTVEAQATAPMLLLEPRRMVADEGFGGALMVAFNILRKPEARRRVVAMRRVFQKHRDKLSAITLVARKPE